MEPGKLICKSCGGRLEQRGQDYHCPECGGFRLDEQGNFRSVNGTVQEPNEPVRLDVPKVDGPVEAGRVEADGPDADGPDTPDGSEPTQSDTETERQANPKERPARKARRFMLEIQIGDGEQ